MLILISPAKTLDLTPTERDLPGTKPEFHNDAKELAKIAKQLSPQQIAKFMRVSEQLAQTTHGYFQSWKQKWNAKSAKQTVLTFRGDVYQGLDADTLSDDDLLYAQDHLAVLSGLYGLLRPLDLMQGYRLEMGRALKNPRGKDLYAYWQDRVTNAVNRAATKASAAADSEPIVVNLASTEYARVVKLRQLGVEVITPQFKDLHNGEYKTLGFFAKRARGLMTRHLLRKRATSQSQVRQFRAAGYRYNQQLSTPNQPVFTRDEPAE